MVSEFILKTKFIFDERNRKTKAKIVKEAMAAAAASRGDEESKKKKKEKKAHSDFFDDDDEDVDDDDGNDGGEGNAAATAAAAGSISGKVQALILEEYKQLIQKYFSRYNSLLSLSLSIFDLSHLISLF